MSPAFRGRSLVWPVTGAFLVAAVVGAILQGLGVLAVVRPLESRGAFVPFVSGSVVTIAGPTSEMPAVRRGFGVPVMKSLPLMFVSVLPPFFRKSAVVLLGAGALVPPSLQFAVVP